MAKVLPINENKAQCTKCGEIVASESNALVTCSCGQLSIGGGKDMLLREGRYIEKTTYLLNEGQK